MPGSIINTEKSAAVNKNNIINADSLVREMDVKKENAQVICDYTF